MPKIENFNNRAEALPHGSLMHRKPFFKKPDHRRCCSLSAVLLAIGLTLCGYFIGHFYYKAKTGANTVVVKGLAEKDVRADLAIWEMKYVVTDNDILKAQKEISGQTKIIQDFLRENGFKEEEITVGRLETNDLNANPYRNTYENNLRFILTQTITVKTDNVDLVAVTLNKSGDLVQKGIIFNSDYSAPVSYLFTKLNDIKPQMLRESTQNAKNAALEFAKSSSSKVGKIKYANQGVFSILPRIQTVSATEAQQIEKTVRVVSTIEYWLE